MSYLLIQQHSDTDQAHPFPVAVRPDNTVGFRPNPDLGPQAKAWPETLIGFQDDADMQRVGLFANDFQADPETAVGKYPVFIDGTGTMYVSQLPVATVTTVDAEAPTYAA